MDKIPIGRTIAQSVGFSFGRYTTLLGIVWLPIIVIAVAGYFLAVPMAENFRDLVQKAHDHTLVPGQQFPTEMNRWVGLVNLVTVLFYALVYVGVTKEALGVREGLRFIYLSIGMAEIRAMGLYLLKLTFIYVSMFALFLAGGIIGVVVYFAATEAAQCHLVPGNSNIWIPAAIAVAVLPVVVAWIYFGVRLFYFAIPEIVAEKNIGIMRSWELTRGNFWRIIGISVPILIIVLVFEMLVMAVVVVAVFGVGAIVGLHSLKAALTSMPLSQSVTEIWVAFWALLLLISPFLYGLIISPAAFAYRALVPEQPESGGTSMKEAMHA